MKPEENRPGSGPPAPARIRLSIPVVPGLIITVNDILLRPDRFAKWLQLTGRYRSRKQLRNTTRENVPDG